MYKPALLVCFVALITTTSSFNFLQDTKPSTQTEYITETPKINGPVKAIYIDYKGINWNNGSQVIYQAIDAGYNLVIIAFYLQDTVADMAELWSTTSQTDRVNAVNYAHSKGAFVTVSAGGATCEPYSAYSGS